MFKKSFFKKEIIQTNPAALVTLPKPHSKEIIRLDVDALAKEVNSPRSANMVLLGAAASVLQMLSPELLEDGIKHVFARKGEAIVDTNIAAFRAGLAAARK